MGLQAGVPGVSRQKPDRFGDGFAAFVLTLIFPKLAPLLWLLQIPALAK